MKYIIEIPDDVLAETKKVTTARIETICGMPMKKLIECKDCKHWDREDGTFRDFDGKELHECICLNCFNAASGETPCTPAWFYCGNAERKE